MKTLRIYILILAMSTILISCEKDDGPSITGFETELHKEVNKYRVSVGLNELAHKYSILSSEAKAHAEGRANGSISDANVESDMNERWHRVEDKLGVNNVSNEAYISSLVTSQITNKNASETAAAVVVSWAADSIGQIILEGDYTIHGPGEGKTSDGRTYVMHMFCKFTQQ